MSATVQQRPKYATSIVRLVGPLQVQTAIAKIQNAPLDESSPLEVVIREEVKVRGLDQNGLYWKRLGEIAEQAWFNGRQFNSDTWHYYAKTHLMPEEITTKDGEVRSKWEETPDGKLEVISTARLDRKCFSEYTHIVEAFGASLGTQFSANQQEIRRA